MSGIIFLGTNDLPSIREFYLRRVGMEPWLEQEDCIILRHGNLLLGFCQRAEIQKGGIITIVHRTPEEVDRSYDALREKGATPPVENPKYGIYHFFTPDPEGRTLEFQAFLHPVPLYAEGLDLLANRRSIRHFTDTPVPDGVMASIFGSCRYSPTSCNSESHSYVVVRNREVLEFIAATRGSSSAPVGRSPFAVAVCADPAKTRRPEQDGCIAAYHFLLACWTHGVGTCWIAAMDRDDVKDRLSIPREQYLATVTPVGYPARMPETPPRRPTAELVRILE